MVTSLGLMLLLAIHHFLNVTQLIPLSKHGRYIEQTPMNYLHLKKIERSK